MNKIILFIGVLFWHVGLRLMFPGVNGWYLWLVWLGTYFVAAAFLGALEEKR